MLHTLKRLYDTLLPPSDSAQKLRSVSDMQFQRHYCPITNNSVTTLLPYSEPEVKAAITGCKFEHNQRAAKLLHAVLFKWLDAQYKATESVVVLPIPLSRQRKRRRGHNQAETVLHAGPLPPNILVNTKLISRVRDTTAQTSLPRHERLLNVRDAFAVQQSGLAKLEVTHIILLDGVMTTGATLRAAKASLLPHTTLPITCVALAH